MGCFPPRPSREESIFAMYISNVLLAVNSKDPFKGERGKQLLNNFIFRVEKILGNKRFLICPETKCPVWSWIWGGKSEYKSLDEKEKTLLHFCDEITDILFDRKKSLKEMKIRDGSDFLLFLEKTFDFFLSEKNLPSFINLIFRLVNGGNIFTKEEDYEKDRGWLDEFEFKI